MSSLLIDRPAPSLELAKRVYLSVPQLAEYLGWTIPKTRVWLNKYRDVRRSKEGNYLIVWRRDVDDQLAANAAQHAKKQRGAA